MKGELPHDELGVVAIDPLTLQIRLHTPTPHFLQLLAHPSTFPINEVAYRSIGEKLFTPGQFVSNGAYVLNKWNVGSSISLRRNYLFWDNVSTDIERVVYHFVDQNVQCRSNGSKVLASDFEFAFQRLVDPQTAAPYAEFVSAIKNASEIVKGELPHDELGVVAIDPLTLQIRLLTPTPHFLQLLARLLVIRCGTLRSSWFSCGPLYLSRPVRRAQIPTRRYRR